MPHYSTTVTATSNATGGTEDSFADLTAGAGIAANIKRVTVSIQTPASDCRAIVKLCRKSAQGAGSVAGTIVKADSANVRNATSTTQVKSGATAFAAGTITDTVRTWNLNGRALFEWIPRGDEEIVKSGVAGIIGINLIVDLVSIIITVMIEWEE